MGIDRESREPLYYQLKRVLEEKIRTGVWAPEAMIPTENELIRQYQVSRTTIRLALAAMVNDGLLYRRQGKGTFVAGPRIAQSLDMLAGFVEILEQQGLAAQIEVRAVTRERAGPEVARRLALEIGAQVISVERLVKVSGGPLFWAHSHLPAELVGAPRTEDLSSQPLLRWLDSAGHRPEEAWQSMSAQRATQEEAAMLGLRQDDPVLVTLRTAFDGSGQPIEHTRAVFRSDRYAFEVRLRRRPGPIR